MARMTRKLLLPCILAFLVGMAGTRALFVLADGEGEDPLLVRMDDIPGTYCIDDPMLWLASTNCDKDVEIFLDGCRAGDHRKRGHLEVLINTVAKVPGDWTAIAVSYLEGQHEIVSRSTPQPYRIADIFLGLRGPGGQGQLPATFHAEVMFDGGDVTDKCAIQWRGSCGNQTGMTYTLPAGLPPGSYFFMYKATFRNRTKGTGLFKITVDGDKVDIGGGGGGGIVVIPPDDDGGGGGGGGGGEEEECGSSPRPNEGETEAPERIIMVMSSDPNKEPPTDSMVVHHKIVTVDTPKERNLPGKLRLKFESGDKDCVEIRHNGSVYTFGEDGMGPDISVVETGHVGCGRHDWHDGIEFFDLKALKPGKLVIKSICDPDPDEGLDGESQVEAETTIIVAKMGIRGDTDRSGTIDEDDEKDKDKWTWEKGAMYLVNTGYKNTTTPEAISFTKDGTVDQEVKTINTKENVTPIQIIYKDDSEELKLFYRIRHRDLHGIHLFSKRENGKTGWGGPKSFNVKDKTDNEELDITDDVKENEENDTGVEGVFFRNMDTSDAQYFEAEWDLEIVLKDGTDEIKTDKIRMRAAPFLVLPHGQAVEKACVINLPGDFLTQINSSGVGDPYTGNGSNNDQWAQDHAEFVYSAVPTRSQRTTLVMPRGGGQATWMNKYLKPDFGKYRLKNTEEVADYGGNVEALGPKSDWPEGRIVYGKNASSWVEELLKSQEIQKPMTLDVGWLDVGHVDEIYGFHSTALWEASPDEAKFWAFPLPDWVPFFQVNDGEKDHGQCTEEGSLVTLVDSTKNFGQLGFAPTYVRIYEGRGKGQVASVSPGLIPGELTVSRVWNIGSKIVGNNSLATFIQGDEIVEESDQWYEVPDQTSKYVVTGDVQNWMAEVAEGVYNYFPALITVGELKADTDFINYNTDVQNKISQARMQLINSTQDTLTFRRVPVFFFGDSAGGVTKARALNPNLANSQEINGKIYYPRQYGPSNVFEGVSTLQNQVSTPDWDGYHRKAGDVHCGTNTIREVFSFDWWDQVPQSLKGNP